MDGNNFLLWQNIAFPILWSYKLERHLTLKDVFPEMSIILPPLEDEPQGLLLLNPEYDIWIAVDQLLIRWLYNSMTIKVASQVTGHDTTKGLCEALFYGLQASSQKDASTNKKRKLQDGRISDFNETLC